MKATIENDVLVIDGSVKHCPYQPVIPYQENTALGAKTGFIRQPCGKWCAHFRVNVVDDKPRSVALWCTTNRYELDQAL